VCAGGGSVGVLLGGLLTSALDWHWIFLVNIPIGAVVFAWCLRLLPGGGGHAAGGKLDVAGALTVTTAVMLAVYAICTRSSTATKRGGPRAARSACSRSPWCCSRRSS
jgi:predicted MFS family arabinose efflux permease